jgi:hypothetical protein
MAPLEFEVVDIDNPEAHNFILGHGASVDQTAAALGA